MIGAVFFGGYFRNGNVKAGNAYDTMTHTQTHTNTHTHTQSNAMNARTTN